MNLSKTTIAMSCFVLLSGAGYFYSNKKANEPLFKEVPLFAQSPTFQVTPESMPAKVQEERATQTPPSQGVSSYVAKNRSVSRQVALSQATADRWYESIVSEVEGYRAKPYFDNRGIAVGFGWNVGQQSWARNLQLANAIGMDESSIQALLPYSGNPSPTSLPRAVVTPEQAGTAVSLMREQYEAPMRKLVPSFGSLKPNEQDALVYHAYKVGGGGAAKYKNMLQALRNYSADPSEANKLKVASTFIYKYTLNGKTFTDSRSTLYLAALFISPEAYSYLLGTSKAPANFSQVAKIAHQNIDTSKSAQEQIRDDFGDAKEELLRQGIPFTVINEELVPQKRARKSAGIFYGI